MSTTLEHRYRECRACNGTGNDPSSWDGECSCCDRGEVGETVELCNVCGCEVETCGDCGEGNLCGCGSDCGCP